MGRTLTTYRMRIQEIRNRMMKFAGNQSMKIKYMDLWTHVHNLSAPASSLPWPDSHAVATFCMVLEAMKTVEMLEKELEQLKNNVQ